MAPRFLRPLLRSRFVWRATGWTLATSIRATRGRFESVPEYLEDCRAEMAPFGPVLDASTRLFEFGCGPGGNLLAVRDAIAAGVGIDVNSGYIRHAQRLARRLGASTISFRAFDGTRLPAIEPRPTVALALGVFERIPAPKTADYLDQIARLIAPNGRLYVDLLSPRARATPFTDLLGDEAYTYWTDADVESLCRAVGLRNLGERPIGPFRTSGNETAFAGTVFTFGRTASGSGVEPTARAGAPPPRSPGAGLP